MRALTLYPEWPWAFTVLDKRLENRGWRPPSWLMGKYFCLHSGARINGGASVKDGLEGLEYMAQDAGWETRLTRIDVDAKHFKLCCTRHGDGVERVLDTRTMVKSAIMCVVKLVGVKFNQPLPWAIPNSLHWIIDEKVHVLEQPVHTPGQRGLWKLDDYQLRAVMEQVEL